MSSTNFTQRWQLFARQSGPLKRFGGFQRKKTTAHKYPVFLQIYNLLCWVTFLFFCLELLLRSAVFSRIRSRRRKKRQKWEKLATEGKETFQKNGIIQQRYLLCGNSDWIFIAFVGPHILNLDFVFTLWSKIWRSASLIFIIFSLWFGHLVSFSLCHSLAEREHSFLLRYGEAGEDVKK